VFIARYAKSPCIKQIPLVFRRKNVRFVIGKEYERRRMDTIVAYFRGGYCQVNFTVERVRLRCICARTGVLASARIMSASTSPSKGSYNISSFHVPYLSLFPTLRTPNSALWHWQHCRMSVSVCLGQSCICRKYIEIGTWHFGTHLGRGHTILTSRELMWC
jgi:hypothetical protein